MDRRLKIALCFLGVVQLTVNGEQNVKVWGAKGDGLQFIDGAMGAASSTPTLTSSTATFTSLDVGKLICVASAGTSGTELCSTISSVMNSHNVVLTDASHNPSPISAQEFRYATNDDSAIAAALTAACGSALYFPAGNYGSAGAQKAACTTNSVLIHGDGATTPDYVNVVANQLGGNTASALWVLSKTASPGTALFLFATGAVDNTTGVQQYRYPQVLRDIAFNAGVGGNLDGACSTCNGLYFLTGTQVNMDNVAVTGFGQDGIVFDATWRAHLGSSFIASNGRYGVNVTSTHLVSGNVAAQNIGIYDSDISENGSTGVEVTNIGGGIVLLNNLIQWNGVVSGSNAYEVDFGGVARQGTALISGNWFERGNNENMINMTHIYGPDGPLVGGNVLFSGSNPFACASAAAPAVCGVSTYGSVAIPVGTNPSLVVNTIAITAAGRVTITADASLGSLLGVTCNTDGPTNGIPPYVSARTAATSFTLAYTGTITTNPLCVNFVITN